MRIIRLLVKFIGIAAAIWTIGASVYIIFAPTQSQVSMGVALPDGTVLRQEEHITENLVQREGWLGVIGFILWPLSLPIALGITEPEQPGDTNKGYCGRWQVRCCSSASLPASRLEELMLRQLGGFWLLLC
jgi:hypothetical protein